ncbi:hypothetical protein [Marinisporobacter balticus]|uniref:Uncharacterized protein n=1 Tax=Marinisporobacter balticus TaxID=2018667 RepID=A0A4R2KEZ4_9FIRM|nr:hypothetical protein [Marinisporobacter balticus]TCO68879.1 hypothetical protein EV214_13822 [Marinisporobacter balticus]
MEGNNLDDVFTIGGEDELRCAIELYKKVILDLMELIVGIVWKL